jgi:hypothetical protein
MKPLNRVLPLMVFLALASALAGCGRGPVQELSPLEVLQAPVLPPPGSFSLAACPSGAWLVYADPETRALVLADLQGAVKPAYLDRVTDLLEQDPLLGAHLLFAEGDNLHLLYLDRQSEESMLLKYVRKTGSEAAVIDVLPVVGRPVAAFVLAGGALDLFLERDQGLYREGPLGSTVPLLLPFRPAGPASRIASGETRGFTVFDSGSRRLLLFLEGGTGVRSYTVARFGEAQDSLLTRGGRIQTAAYDPHTSHLVLFESSDPDRGFSVQPVTLSRDTDSLALIDFDGRPGFLFNETAPRGERRHLISLLYPSGGSGTAYEKAVLHRSSRPASGLRAVRYGSSVYVAFFEETLRVLRVDLAALGRRQE